MVVAIPSIPKYSVQQQRKEVVLWCSCRWSELSASPMAIPIKPAAAAVQLAVRKQAVVLLLYSVEVTSTGFTSL